MVLVLCSSQATSKAPTGGRAVEPIQERRQEKVVVALARRGRLVSLHSLGFAATGLAIAATAAAAAASRLGFIALKSKVRVGERQIQQAIKLGPRRLPQATRGDGDKDKEAGVEISSLTAASPQALGGSQHALVSIPTPLERTQVREHGGARSLRRQFSSPSPII